MNLEEKKKRGRPKRYNGRKYYMGIRLTEKEKTHIEELAFYHQISESAVVRRAIEIFYDMCL